MSWHPDRARAAASLAVLLAACGSRTVPPVGDGGSEPDGGAAACPCEAEDRDGDGALGPPCGTDCDDGDGARYPGARDPAGDGVDADCDGADGVDLDGDGFFAATAGGDDCDDTLAFVRPGAPDGVGWAIEPFEAGIRTQLVLDRWGKPLVAFASWLDDDLPGSEAHLHCPDHPEDEDLFDGTETIELARWEHGSWTTELVEEACTEEAIGLAVTDRGEPAVAYAAFTWSGVRGTATEPSELHVARATRGPGWQVEAMGPAEGDVVLAAQPCGALVVAHSLGPPRDGAGVKVSFEGATGWETEVVDPGYEAGGLAMAQAPGGGLLLSYFRIGAQWNDDSVWTPFLASREERGWVVESLGEPQYDGTITDTAVAPLPEGGVVIAYEAQEGLFALEGGSDQWSRTALDVIAAALVDMGNESQSTLSVGVEREDVVHLAGLTGHPPGRVTVSHATLRNGAWLAEDLTVADWAGELGWPALALDRLGGVHMVWYSFDESVYSRGVGRYAYLAAPRNGLDEDCDGVDGVDADGDGRASIDTGGDDPDDTTP